MTPEVDPMSRERCGGVDWWYRRAPPVVPSGSQRCPGAPIRCPRSPGCRASSGGRATTPRRASAGGRVYHVATMTDPRPADVAPAPGPGIPAAVPLDRLGRRIHDLRISVTDRCNFRCSYCMPAEVFGRDHPFFPRRQILTFEEIARLARLFVALGAEKLRITGGEPTVRRDLPDLVRMLASIDGVRDLTLTTNGSALRRLAGPLAEAGLRRITVSLDSLDDEVFRRMNGIDFPVSGVLDGIEAAREAGLAPIKVNMVVRRGVNEESVLPVARWARDAGVTLRFIEFMDVGHTNGWRMDDVVPGVEILARVAAALPLEALPAGYPGEVARRFRYLDGRGEVGVISSVSEPFCGACTRARLSADGGLFTCLFGARGADLKSPLRAGASDADLLELISAAWATRADRYSELRAAGSADLPRVEMFAMGG
jgi:cyclic pyranopterin phosphate synthase